MNIKRTVTSVRNYRTYHRYLGLTLSLLLIISAITGLLLGWKKNVEWLQPSSQQGISANIAEFQPVEKLTQAAILAVDSLQLDEKHLDRIEYRPDKGMAKVRFTEGQWEVQVDAVTLKILSVAKRNSDWIEQLHDGSIISETFKLISMNFLGIGLTLLIISGLWLYFGPKRIRALKAK